MNIMEKVYLIIFMIFISLFVYWHQHNELPFGLKISFDESSDKKRKKHKKHRKHKKSKHHKRRKHHIEPETESNSESTDSRIKTGKKKLKRAYEDENDETDDQVTLDSLSMKQNDTTDNSGSDISLDSASSSDFMTRDR